MDLRSNTTSRLAYNFNHRTGFDIFGRIQRLSPAVLLPVALLMVAGLGMLFTIRSASAQSSVAPNNLFVTTLAGIITSGYVDGVGTSARFNGPLGIAVDSADNVIVADFRNARIRRVAPDGRVSTIAGSGTGYVDGTGIFARFNSPSGVAVNRDGNIVVADYGNNRIRLLTPGGTATTIAGSGVYGSANGNGRSASFAKPSGVAVDAAGNLYVLDAGTSLVRQIDPKGNVKTLSGGGLGYTDIKGKEAQFSFAGGAPQPAIDRNGNLVIPDFLNCLIRSVDLTGQITTLAGGGSQKDGAALEASFLYPVGVAPDRQGNLIIADWSNSLVRKYDVATKTVTTLAGTGEQGDSNGAANQSRFYRPAGVAVDSKGNIYVSDYFGNAIRKISGVAPKPTPSPTPVVTPSPTPAPLPGGTTPPAPKPLNLIYNPSFETGDFSGWRIYTYYVGDGGAFAVTGASNVSDGQYALQLKASGRILVDNCAQDLELPPGNYVLSCEVIPSLGTKASLMVNFNDGTPPVAVSTSESGKKTTLTLNFSVTRTDRPLTISAVGDQRRYVRSNLIVDNFRLYSR
jgi:sugar lactone lactonase YvrE